MITRATVTLKPILLAVLSDSTSTLHQANNEKAAINPIKPYVTMIVTSSHVFNVKFDVIAPVEDAPKLINASVNPENIALIAIPTKMSFNGFNPDFHDNKNTRKQASAPPMNAAIGEKKK